jgi:hypothetical protein
MSVPASGNVTLTGINSVFGKAVGFSLASYAGTIAYDVTTGAAGATLAVPITMRSSFLNKTPLGKVGKPTITVTENAAVAGGTLTNCVTISWSAPTGATPTGYTVEVSTDGSTFATLSNTASTSVTHTPTSNQSYWYRARATTATANGAWSSNSGAAVFPYSTSPIIFYPPVLATFTMIGAAGGKGLSTSYPVAQTYGTRVTGLAFNDAYQTRIAFGGAGGNGTAGAAFPSFTLGNTWSGGAGGTGWNANAGGGGGASIIVTSGFGFLIVGGAGGGGDSGKWYGKPGGQAGNAWFSWTGYLFAQAAGSDGGWTTTAGAPARGGSISGGGAGGQGANRNAPAGGNGTGYTLGAGGNGTSDDATAGGGGGGGWNGGGGGACAENQPGWGGQYQSGGGGGGMSLMSQTGIFNVVTPNPAISTIVSYPSSGWAFSTW